LGLQEASSKEGFALLLGSFAKLRTRFRVGNKRVFDPALFEEETERTLWREYLKAEGKMEGLLAELDYEQAIDQLTSLWGAINRYAEDVDPGAGSEEVRNNRLGLIASIVGLYTRVGNFAALLETDGYAPGEEKK
jgi:glycyl-tRNA synthetase beta chain